MYTTISCALFFHYNVTKKKNLFEDVCTGLQEKCFERLKTKFFKYNALKTILLDTHSVEEE